MGPLRDLCCCVARICATVYKVATGTCVTIPGNGAPVGRQRVSSARNRWKTVTLLGRSLPAKQRNFDSHMHNALARGPTRLDFGETLVVAPAAAGRRFFADFCLGNLPAERGCRRCEVAGPRRQGRDQGLAPSAGHARHLTAGVLQRGARPMRCTPPRESAPSMRWRPRPTVFWSWTRMPVRRRRRASPSFQAPAIRCISNSSMPTRVLFTTARALPPPFRPSRRRAPRSRPDRRPIPACSSTAGCSSTGSDVRISPSSP